MLCSTWFYDFQQAQNKQKVKNEKKNCQVYKCTHSHIIKLTGFSTLVGRKHRCSQGIGGWGGG